MTLDTTPSTWPPSRLASARAATRAQFFALGFLSGCWGVHVPSAKAHYQLSAGELSLALLAVAVGAVLCLIRAGRVVHAFGPRRVVVAAGVVACGALAAVLLPSSFAALLVVMLVFGASTALVDVSVNAEGSLLEKLGGRKVMSGFHGMWSAGGMSGAGLGALLLKADMAPLYQMLLMAALALVVVLVAQRGMLEGPAPQDAAPASAAGGVDAAASAAGGADAAATGWRRPHGLLLLLGALGVSGLLAEGAMYDWSVLWMQQDLGQPQAFAALAYAAFAAAMAANRFAGDWLRTHISAPRLMTVSGLFAAAAMATALLLRQPTVALVAFVIVGAGLANLVPIIFMAASHVPGVPAASGIATVSGLGYIGFVLGPPIIGGIAQTTSLSGALWVVVVALLLQALGARWLPK